MTITRPCDKLHSFADGELPIDEVPAFERHLVECPACQEELKSVMMLEALGYGLSAASPPPSEAITSPEGGPGDDPPAASGPRNVVELSSRRH